MSLNQGWLIISEKPLLDPSLFEVSLSKQLVIKFLQSSLIGIPCFLASGNMIVLVFILSISYYLSEPLKKGVKPTISSYVNTPIDHQSTEKSYGLWLKISGAIYSGVPQ